MSKQDNLTDFLTDVADAIREKKGTTEKINPQNFSEEIRGIESGGGAAWVEPEYSDVNFFDYDGTLLYAFKWEEAEAMTEMPVPPYEHEGLVFDGWNYTLEDMKAQGDYAEIGALYTTDNGRTKIKCRVGGTLTLNLTQTIPNSAIIHWGDGTSEMTGEELTISHSHVYNSGNATIEIEVIQGNITFRQSFIMATEINLSNNFILDGQSIKQVYGLTKMSVPDGYNFATLCFHSAALNYIVIPKSEAGGNHLLQDSSIKGVSMHTNVNITSSTLYNEASIRRIVFPATAYNNYGTDTTSKFPYANVIRMAKNAPTSNITVVNNTIMKGTSVFRGSAASILPDYTTSIGNAAFQNSMIGELCIPDSVTSIGASAFYSANALREIICPNVGGELNQTFRNMASLTKVVLGDITKISNYCFYYNSNLKYLYLDRCTSVPILSDTGSFFGTHSYLKIIVPDALYDEWIAATNWSGLASKIVKASEFVEPTT